MAFFILILQITSSFIAMYSNIIFYSPILHHNIHHKLIYHSHIILSHIMIFYYLITPISTISLSINYIDNILLTISIIASHSLLIHQYYICNSYV